MEEGEFDTLKVTFGDETFAIRVDSDCWTSRRSFNSPHTRRPGTFPSHDHHLFFDSDLVLGQRCAVVLAKQGVR